MIIKKREKSKIPLLIVTFLFLILLAWNIPVTTTEVLPSFVNVKEGIIGIHMTEDEQKEFNFDTLFPGAIATKTLNLSRGNSAPARVHLSVKGEIADWTTFDRNDFILDEPAKVNATLTIPRDSNKGKYTGNITIQYSSSYCANMMQRLSWSFTCLI